MANVSEVESVPLFDGNILKDIDLSRGLCRLHECGLSTSNPGPTFCMRPLCSDDLDKGFLDLLSELTKVGNITREKFLSESSLQEDCCRWCLTFRLPEWQSSSESSEMVLSDDGRFNSMRGCPETYYVIVIENKELRKVVACGTLVVEQKFVHETALRGRVEDIVVGESCRGKKFGKLVVETLLLLSEKLGCYKTSLECRDPLHSFYTQFGFNAEKGQNYLCRRFYH